jgi:hypothetical protein
MFKESAKIAGYPQYSIRANYVVRRHLYRLSVTVAYSFQDMTKFADIEDNGYKKIRNKVKKWLDPLRG